MSNGDINIKIGTIEVFDYRSQVSLISPDYRLFLVKAGYVKVEMNNKVFKLIKNGVFIVNDNEKIQISLSNDIDLICITIPKSNMTRYSEFDSVKFDCNSALRDGIKYEELRRLIDRIARLSNEESNIVLNSQYLILLNELLVNYIKVSSEKDERKKEHLKYFKRNLRIKDFVEENYNHDISLSDLADELKLSLSYTSRFFNEQFGLSFPDYLNGVRILNAADDLIYTDLTVIKIAMINGFTNVSRFNSVFKQKYGSTPSSYRIKQRREVQNFKDHKFNIDDLNRRHKMKMGDRINSYVTSEVVQKEDCDVDIQTVKKKLTFGFRSIMNFGFLERKKILEEVQKETSNSALYGFKYARIKITTLNKELISDLFDLIEIVISKDLIPFINFIGMEITDKDIRSVLSQLINRFGYPM